MTYHDVYDELMSLKLDGLLDQAAEGELDAHLASCAECSQLWAVMQEADTLLCATAAAPVAVPVSFHVEVMALVAAAPVGRPQLAPAYEPWHSMQPDLSVLPWLSGPFGQAISLFSIQEWEHRIATYMRGIVIGSLSIAGALGLLLVLAITGSIQTEGPLADAVSVLRTFLGAIDTWARSLFVGVGPAVLTISGIVFGLLALAGWQLVASYHRTAYDQPIHANYAEALS